MLSATKHSAGSAGKLMLFVGSASSGEWENSRHDLYLPETGHNLELVDICWEAGLDNPLPIARWLCHNDARPRKNKVHGGVTTQIRRSGLRAKLEPKVT